MVRVPGVQARGDMEKLREVKAKTLSRVLIVASVSSCGLKCLFCQKMGHRSMRVVVFELKRIVRLR